MRSYLKSTQSPIAKPAKSQSPIQKKKCMKFVNQVARTIERSMHELPILKLDSREASSPIPEFKRVIEEKFEKSGMKTYVFPRRIFTNYSVLSEESDDCMNGVVEYDLHIQNFMHQIPHLRMHSQPDSKPTASDHSTIMQHSSSRVATTSSEATNQSRVNWRHGIKMRPQTPVEESSLLYKKAVGLLRQHSQKTLTHRKSKSPQKNVAMDALKNKIKHKIKNSQDFSIGKENPTIRSQSTSKSASRGKFTNANGMVAGRALENSNVVKISELIEDDSCFVSRALRKAQTARSCQDLKTNSAKTLAQSTEAGSSMDTTTYLRSEKAQSKSSVKFGYGNLTNKFAPFDNISESITQNKMKRPTRVIKGQIDKENLTARSFNQSRSRIEVKGTSFYDKKIRETPSRDRSIESYRSPKRSLNTEPLTARNFNESRAHSKTPTKKTKGSGNEKKLRDTPSRDRSIESYRSPKRSVITEPLTARNFNESRVHSKTPTKKAKRPVYENVVCITSPGKQNSPIKLTVNQQLHTKLLREYENSLVRLAKAASSQSSRSKVPPIAVRNFGQGQVQASGGLQFVSTTARVKKEKSPMAKAKLESQMLLKRSGAPTSARYDLDRSELRAKLSHYK